MYNCLQAARGSITREELTPEQRQALMGEEDQQKITTYEEAFKQIKEATGVSDTQVGMSVADHLSPSSSR